MTGASRVAGRRALALALALGSWLPGTGRSQVPDTSALGPRLSLETVVARTLAYSPSVIGAAGTVRDAAAGRRVALGAGVIAARNVDPGTLLGTAGGVSSTLAAGSGSAPGSLFRVAQTDTLSVYVTVPEDYAAAVAIGKPAVVTVPALPGDTLRGRVVRTAGALDPTARTLLTEVQVVDPEGVFLPGMYADVQLGLSQGTAPLQVPATALVIRDGPPQVVTVAPDSTARYQTVTVGRDHGSWVEVTGGLAEGARVVLNATDGLRDGARVRLASVAGNSQ